MAKKLKITRKQYENAMRDLLEVGYGCASEETQKICDADDNMNLIIVE